MEIHLKILELKKSIGKVSKDSTNPFFKSKYMDLNTLLEAVEPLLHEKGLLLLQPLELNVVKTLIIDCKDDSQFVESWLKIPDLDDPQKIGSCITYFRRYTLKSLLGIQEEDDDANTTTTNPNKEITWLSKENFEKALNSDVKGMAATLQKFDSPTFKMKKEYKTELDTMLNSMI